LSLGYPAVDPGLLPRGSWISQKVQASSACRRLWWGFTSHSQLAPDATPATLGLMMAECITNPRRRIDNRHWKKKLQYITSINKYVGFFGTRV